MKLSRIALLFQYGSNCSEGQINGPDRLRGEARFVSIAETVDDYELVFNVWGEKRRSAGVDIVPSPGSKVRGVVYDVPMHLIDRAQAREQGRVSMDDIEYEGELYRRYEIEVCKPDGGRVRALTYTVIDPQGGLRAGLEYVGYIVSGLREHGVDDAYMASVKETAALTNPDIADRVRQL